jgi:hypothetical protein
VIAIKEYYDSVLVKEIQQQNDDVPESTEVDSAEVSLINKSLPDRPCGLVVIVPGYRSRGYGFDSRRYQIF